MLDLFLRATQDALALLGEESVLRGGVQCRVNVEHGVRVARMEESYSSEADLARASVERDVATIPASLSPRVGDSLAHPAGNYRLDAVLEDRGAYKRFILLKVA